MQNRNRIQMADETKNKVLKNLIKPYNFAKIGLVKSPIYRLK